MAGGSPGEARASGGVRAIGPSNPLAGCSIVLSRTLSSSGSPARCGRSEPATGDQSALTAGSVSVTAGLPLAAVPVSVNTISVPSQSRSPVAFAMNVLALVPL
jgi:hypothetical protein